MRAKFEFYLRLLREGAVRVVTAYPVESLLALYACVLGIWSFETDCDTYPVKLSLAPIFFALALVVNVLAGRSAWRKLYWVSWTPIVPLSLWGGLEAWITSEPALITFGILTPLALVLCRRAAKNERFVADFVVWLRSGVLAFLFGNIALGLFGAILFSTKYIFGLEGEWILHTWVWVLIMAEALAVPILFLMMYDRWAGAECRGNRIAEMLLNYIVTPALLIYTVILYLYMGKILVTWELPAGGVAYLVFGFTIFALIVKAAQSILDRRIYDWFFDRFSLVSIPTQVLFWIGVMRRVGEYGLTAPRLYLLVCGGVMTLCVLLFLSKRAGRYLYVCVAGFVAFAALAYIPALRPERIASRSQTARVERVARALDRLDSEHRLILTPVELSDTVRLDQYRDLYDALEYIRYRDTTALRSFGIEKLNDFTRIFPERMRYAVEYGTNSFYRDELNNHIIDLELPYEACVTVDASYPKLYTNLRRWGTPSWDMSNDTLKLSLSGKKTHEIPCAELLRVQLEKSGFRPDENVNPTPEQLMQMLDYRDDKCRVIFGNMKLERTDSILVVHGVVVNAVMTR